MPDPDPAQDAVDPENLGELVVERAILARLRGEEADVEALVAELGGELSEADLAEIRRRLDVFEATRALAQGGEAGPRVYGDFAIEGEIGRGGMGVVYLARQLSLERRVALKVLPSLAALEGRRVERFLREASLLGKLEHEGIVPVLTAGEDDGTLFFAMPYVRGIALDRVFAELEGVPVEERRGEDLARIVSGSGEVDPGAMGGLSYTAAVVGIAARVADALAYAHARGVVHRDVKPSNVILAEGGRPMLIDFGLAKGPGEAALTGSLDLLGTPSYLPPEHVRGDEQIGELSDVYSLGVLLYEMLCGKRPFEGPSVAALLERVERADFERPRAVVRGLPRDLETICLKAMESDPALRYPTMAELAADLAAFLEYRPIRARPAGLARRIRMRARRQPALAWGAGAILAATLVASAAPAVRAAVRAREARSTTRELRAAIAGGELASADELLAHLTAIDEEHPERAELASAVDLARCDRSLADAAGLRAELDLLEGRLGELDREILVREKRIGATFAGESDRRELALRRAEREEVLASREQRRVELENALHLAETWSVRGGADGHPPVQRALADYYAARFRAARAGGDEIATEVYRDLTADRDDEGRHTNELLGYASVRIDGPNDARAWLFRYERLDRWNEEAWLDRLVPVPFRLRAPADAPLSPGALCLELVEVLEGGGARVAGLREGDLVFEVDGSRALAAPFVFEVVPGSFAEQDGVRAWDRIVSVNGAPTPRVTDLLDAEGANGPFRVGIASGAEEWEVDSADLAFDGIDESPGVAPVALPALFANVPLPRPIVLGVFRDGELLELELPGGEVPAALARLSVAPLLTTQDAALGMLPGDVEDLEPGSYLLLVRRPGCRELRLPFVLPPLEELRLAVDLPRSEDAPSGCVWIPPGELRRGTDPLGTFSAGPEVVHVDGFWMSVWETTMTEWWSLLADPAVLDRVNARVEATGLLHLVPRNEASTIGIFGNPEPRWYHDPVRGLDFNDVRAYLDHVNARLRREGSPWVADVPTDVEWERAAAGADDRPYPWGGRFDPSLCQNAFSKRSGFWEPVFAYPTDESPFGVRGLGGSVSEWTSTLRDLPEESRYIHGGSKHHSAAETFRIQCRTADAPHLVKRDTGFRLVFRPRPAPEEGE